MDPPPVTRAVPKKIWETPPRLACLSLGMLYILVRDSMISEGLSEIWGGGKGKLRKKGAKWVKKI